MSLRDRIFGAIKRRLRPDEPFERRFGPQTAERWAELREPYALGFQTLASSIVASWEVAAAELHAAGFRPEQVTRFSDALVPTLQPMQDAERATKALWTQGVADATAVERFEPLTAPLFVQVRGLGRAVEEGYGKTVAWLAPLLDERKASVEARERLAPVGPIIRTSLDGHAAVLCSDLGDLAHARDLEATVLDAVETYRHGASRDLEIALDDVRAALLA